MKWSNGGPPRLYILIVNETGEIMPFTRKQDRTTWLVARHRTYGDGVYSFLTYVQKEGPAA